MLTLHVQVGDFACVVLDELTPWLDAVAHQHREDLVGRARVVDADHLKRPVLGGHRGVEELVGVHLAEPLEALERNAVAADLEHPGTELLERERVALLLAEHDVERRRSREFLKLAVDPDEARVLGGLEDRASERVSVRRARLALDHLGDDVLAVLLDQLGRIGLTLRVVCPQHLDDLAGVGDTGVEQRGFLEEGDRVMAPLGAQRRRPALVLLEQAAVLLPARVCEAEGGAVAVGDRELLELVPQQDLLELGLLFDVDILLARLDLVERRLRDVDEARVDQLGHLAVEEGEHQRADVGAVHVGVGHDDDLVIARLRDVELLADPGADRRDQRLDLLVRQHLVDAVLLDVDDLAAQRQDRLGVAVAALLGRAAGRVALDDEDLRERGVADRAVGELARKHRVLERRLAARQVARLARGLAGARGLHGLLDHRAGLARVLLEEFREPLVDRALHEALDRRVAELRLRLALELRVGDLHRDDRGEALADVLALEVRVLLLQLTELARVAVHRACKSRTEAGQVRPTLVSVDVVREGEERLLVGVVPLEGDLDLAHGARALEVDDLRVQRLARALAVQVLHEVDDAAVVLERRLEALGAALVAEADLEAPGEEGHLAEALLERRAVVVDRLEDLEVGQEGDARAAPIRLGALRERAGRDAALVGLLVLVAVAPDGEVEPLGERVDDRNADAVETARHLVAAAVAELAAGVEHGEHYLRGRLLLLLHDADRDAAAVVRDRDAVVGVDGDLDLGRLAGQRLVDRVVHHLVDQVMKTARARRADVHARPLADGLETLENGDVLRAVGAVTAAGRALLRAAALCGLAVARLVATAPLRLAVVLLGLLRQVVPSIRRRSVPPVERLPERAAYITKRPDSDPLSAGSGRYIRPH